MKTLEQEVKKKLDDGYEIEITKLRMPRFKIVGYNGNLPIAEIENCMPEQNAFIEEQVKPKIT